MGKALIVAAKGEGLYSATLQPDRTSYDRAHVRLTANIAETESNLALLQPQIDAAEIATAILAAAQITPIHADTQLINSAPVIGDGTDGDDWRGVGVPPTVV